MVTHYKPGLREYVNEEIQKLTSNKTLTKTQRRSLFKKIWAEAKRKFRVK